MVIDAKINVCRGHVGAKTQTSSGAFTPYNPWCMESQSCKKLKISVFYVKMVGAQSG